MASNFFELRLFLDNVNPSDLCLMRFLFDLGCFLIEFRLFLFFVDCLRDCRDGNVDVAFLCDCFGLIFSVFECFFRLFWFFVGFCCVFERLLFGFLDFVRFFLLFRDDNDPNKRVYILGKVKNGLSSFLSLDGLDEDDDDYITDDDYDDIDNGSIGKHSRHGSPATPLSISVTPTIGDSKSNPFAAVSKPNKLNIPNLKKSKSVLDYVKIDHNKSPVIYLYICVLYI